MEINIKPNTAFYEVKEEVVQSICNAFLMEIECADGGYDEERYLVCIFKDGHADFDNSNACHTIEYEPNSFEMHEAFRQLIKAGYFMFKHIGSDGDVSYHCWNYPECYLHDAYPIYYFDEFKH